MKIHLPNTAFLGNIDPFLKSFDNTGPGKLEITANKKWISVHPAVICMVAALGLEVGKENVTCEKIEAKSGHYLERMGLSRMLGVKQARAIKEHEPAGRFIPLTVIKDSSGLTDFIREIVPLLHLQPDQAEPIKYVISELVRNVLEHAGSANGAVLCVQYYKKSNSIKIGIADRGVGIKNTINVSHKADTHLDAIRLALMPGITGTTPREGGTETNAGAGLFFIKSIAKINKEFFVIYSGNAMYKLLKGGRAVNHVRLHADPFEDKHSGREDLPFWNGTVVGIDISLDSTREFSLLLDAIRETYLKAVKERKQERHRKPKFI